jgi:hypothetical protein
MTLCFLVVLSVIGFVVVKVSPAGNYAYAWAIGAMRWPLQAVSHADGALQLRAILVSRDLADLLALVFSPVPFLLIRNRTRGTSGRRVRARMRMSTVRAAGAHVSKGR